MSLSKNQHKVKFYMPQELFAFHNCLSVFSSSFAPASTLSFPSIPTSDLNLLVNASFGDYRGYSEGYP